MYKATINEDGLEVVRIEGHDIEVIRNEIERYAHQYISDFKKVFKIEIKEIKGE